jgi:CubicO group peptidase (beta-lactamase class C family)
MHSKILLFCLISILIFGLSPAQSQVSQAAATTPDITSIIEKYRQEIPQRMQQENIPGLSIAIVDDQGILWAEGFGYTDWNRRTPVSPDTLFSIQSMSKSFTATAAMFAAQDGLVDLDAPITDYLPDFHVNSIFEANPEQKITLRMLLSHTAGFAHEAPYGGNYDHPAYSFEKHIESISSTWLKFPVGKYYSYSNLGIDLAGYILQVRSGVPFTQYVQEKILQPLGMKNSTLDVNQVRADHGRAIGHATAPIPPPVDFLLIPSGGVWTTAADMGRYLQFHINEGAIDGNRLLQEDLAETMYTPPNLAAEFSHYALCLAVESRYGVRQFQHGGGGFGFNSSMVWYPDLKLGSVVLTNSTPDVSYAYDLSEDVLSDIIAGSPGLYSQRAKTSAPVEPAYPPLTEDLPLTTIQLRNLISSKALPEDTSTLNRRSTYTGTYIIQSFGLPGNVVEISDDNGTLSCSFMGNKYQVTEVEPGLFFAAGGDALDLRGPTPMMTNIHLIKANTQVKIIRTVLYSICGLVLLLSILFWPIRALILNFKKNKVPAASGVGSGSRWISFAKGLAALASFFSLLCLGLIVSIPNFIYFRWPPAYAELKWWQASLFYLPYASLIVAAMAIVITGFNFKKQVTPRFTQIFILIVALVLFICNAVLLI